MKKRLFFGRVKSRKLSSSNILLTNKFLKKFIIKKNIFRKKKIVIEIGHGMGENLLNLADKNKVSFSSKAVNEELFLNLSSNSGTSSEDLNHIPLRQNLR